MTARVPHLDFALDPLIAEAKRRARRRRYLVGLAVVAAGALALALAFELRHGMPSRGGIAAPSPTRVPNDRLIVPGVSIGGIRFGTPRRDVEKRLGTGKPVHRDLVWYMGERLEVVYSFHGAYTGRVQALITTWPGFETRSGVRVGSTREGVRTALHFPCGGGTCSRGLTQTPDAQGTILSMRNGKVAEIFVGSD